MLTPASLTNLSPEFGASTSLGDIIEAVPDIVARLLNTRLAVVARIESTTYTVMSVVDQHHAIRRGQFYNVLDTFCMHMLETGQPLRIDDIAQAPSSLRVVPPKLELNIQSYLGVPLFMEDGRVFGSLWVANSTPRHFSDGDVASLQLFARLLMPELSQAELSRHSERIEQAQAIYPNIDPSTGLFAADSFEAALQREAARHNRSGSVHAVAVLTIEACESAKERYGESAGDTLRQALADIIMRTSRLVDCCARIDDNVFAVLFAETNAPGVAAWRKRIDAAVDAWNRMHTARELALEIGVGIADCTEDSSLARRPNALVASARQRAEAALRSEQQLQPMV